LKDGKILSAAQEERFTRIKHDHQFPQESIKYCLKHSNISIEDISHIVFYEKPFDKFDRILNTYFQIAPKGILSFLESMPIWIRKKLWLRDLLLKETNANCEGLFCRHHESHAASAFFPSPFESSAILTMDGVGEWSTATIGIGRGNSLELTHELRFPHSLGLLYSAFTYYAGFKVNSGEYKLMGLAPYGEPKFVDLILKELIDLKEDGSFRLNMEYFGFCEGQRMTNKKFHRLFGAPPRERESGVTQHTMDIARSIQDVTEMVVLNMAKFVRKVTGEKNLCLSGGVALNCVANGKLLRSKIFDDIWIQPASGDSGGAVGAALMGYHVYLDQKRELSSVEDKNYSTYLGPSYDDDQIESMLQTMGASYHKNKDTDLIENVSNILKDGNIVGWFQGRMEFGPRALGNRSIIADPRNREMQKNLNLKIKYRESFRPFAPSIIADHVSDWFELETRSPYMLLVSDVRKDKQKNMDEKEKKLWGIDKLNISRSEIPAVTHVDYSARVQTVHKNDNPKFYTLIQAFEEKTSCPILINTSFNVRGEPIVESPQDAYRCFMRTNMDVLVLGNYILHKNEQKNFIETKDWKKEYELD
jgi:carbamoyltransferase